MFLIESLPADILLKVVRSGEKGKKKGVVSQRTVSNDKKRAPHGSIWGGKSSFVRIRRRTGRGQVEEEEEAEHKPFS